MRFLQQCPRAECGEYCRPRLLGGCCLERSVSWVRVVLAARSSYTPNQVPAITKIRKCKETFQYIRRFTWNFKDKLNVAMYFYFCRLPSLTHSFFCIFRKIQETKLSNFELIHDDFMANEHSRVKLGTRYSV